jgi:effector-binding domain-containing protein
VKKILFGFAGIIALLLLVGFLLPRQAQVERRIVIERPASLVFATLNSFQRFAQWSPWHMLDPNMRTTLTGPRSGVGAKYSWQGNDKVGQGTQTIAAARENAEVVTDLDFGDMGLARARFLLTPAKNGTEVTWRFESDLGFNPIGRYFGLMLDRWIGADYQRGLQRLKALVEQLPNTDITDFKVATVNVSSEAILYMAQTTANDTAAISEGYARAYAAIQQIMKQQGLRPAGAPMAIDGAMTATQFTFEAALPVDREVINIPADAPVKFKRTTATQALKIIHTGSYNTLSESYAKFAAYLAAHGYQPAGHTFSRYIDDPAQTAADALRTEIYWPIVDTTAKQPQSAAGST